MALYKILVDREDNLQRVAVIANDKLQDLYVDRLDHPSVTGAVVQGRISRLVESMNAAFVELPGNREGFLSSEDVRPKIEKSDKSQKITARFYSGQGIVVQVKADGPDGKASALTMDVALPGRFVIFRPWGKEVTVSRRISAPSEKTDLINRISKLVKKGGWIARASAFGADDSIIANEIHMLEEVGGKLLAVESSTVTEPRLLIPPLTASQRAVIEHGNAVESIIFTKQEDADNLAAWCKQYAPDLVKLITVYKEKGNLFDLASCNEEIAKLKDRKVPLYGGGNLVIDQTEAMTVIDVNGGEQRDAASVNITATAEIARQVRLRNLSGIIVIDFIGMNNNSDNQRVLASLRAHTANDSANPNVYGMSPLGLVEMTRTRRWQPLHEVMG